MALVRCSFFEFINFACSHFVLDAAEGWFLSASHSSFQLTFMVNYYTATFCIKFLSQCKASLIDVIHQKSATSVGT